MLPDAKTPQEKLIERLREYYALVRFEHALMLAVAVIIAEVLVLGGFPPLDAVFFLALSVPVFSEMGSFALNDYLDREADRINGMVGRPLVKGTIQPGTALLLCALSFVISILAGYLINPAAFIIALIYNALAILYNVKLKDLPLVGNAFIATTMAVPFIFGSYVYTSVPSETILAVALLGFVSGLAREILKSVEDMEGDAIARKSRTLPMLAGRDSSVVTAALLFFLFVPLTIVPYMMDLALGFASGLLLFIADISILAIAVSLLYTRRKENLARARKYSLAALSCGLVSLMLAALGF